MASARRHSAGSLHGSWAGSRSICCPQSTNSAGSTSARFCPREFGHKIIFFSPTLPTPIMTDFNLLVSAVALAEICALVLAIGSRAGKQTNRSMAGSTRQPRRTGYCFRVGRWQRGPHAFRQQCALAALAKAPLCATSLSLAAVPERRLRTAVDDGGQALDLSPAVSALLTGRVNHRRVSHSKSVVGPRR